MGAKGTHLESIITVHTGLCIYCKVRKKVIQE